MSTECVPSAVLILGHGRSGTNWLLSLLDRSPRTHCRDEPNEIVDGAMNRLPDPTIVREADLDALHEHFDDVLAQVVRSMGERDQRGTPRKVFLRESLRRLGLADMLKHRRMRRVLAVGLPALRRGEWAIPAPLLQRSNLDQLLPVLKIVQAPAWGVFCLHHRPSIQIVHIIRHPGGFLRSWRVRYVAPRDPDAIRRANIARIEAVCEASPAWARRMGDPYAMTIDESELWYWRYASEAILDAGRCGSRHHLVIYERLCEDPSGETARLYAACGLECDEATRSHAQASARPARIDAWRSELTPNQVEAIERVLDGSELAGLWQTREVAA